MVLCALSLSATAAETHYKGLTLETPYPTQTLQLSKTVTVPLTVHNYGLAPQKVDLSVERLPSGWKAHFMGNNRDVGSVFVGSDDTRSVSLKLTPGPDAKTGPEYHVRLHARGTSAASTLPLALSFTKAPPAVLKMQTDLPKLKGNASTTFTYHLTLDNQSDDRISVNLAAQAPQGFEVNFSPQFGSANVTSLPIKAGASKKVDVKVKLPHNASGDSYPIKVVAKAGKLAASTTLTAVVTGSPSLHLSTPQGRLSGSAYAGKTTPVHLVLSNTGGAPAHNVRLNAQSPSHWQVNFKPSEIPSVPANGKVKVTAQVHPAQKSLAGDYMVSISARSDHGLASADADYRVTVQTSTVWGIVGLVIVAIAFVVVGFAVARFGRR